MARDGVFIDGVDPFIVIEKRWVKGMGITLAIVAVEAVETLTDGRAGGVGGPEPPFSKSSGSITGGLECFSDGNGFSSDRPLSGKKAAILGVAIISDFGMTEVTAGEEDAACGGADGGSSVVMGEAHTVFGELVEVRSLDFFLPVAADFSVAEIVGENENDVRFLSGLETGREEKGKEHFHEGITLAILGA